MKPQRRIAIPVPVSTDLLYNAQCWPVYAEAIRISGGVPVRIELDATDGQIAALARSCDGVLLPGSPADVDPASYGRDRQAECAQADPERERADRILLEDAYREAKPVLGICFGAQSLNVWRGGTLIQHLPGVPVNHSAGSSVAVAHAAVINGGGVLQFLTADAKEGVAEDEGIRILINSSHHQAIDRLGDGLRLSGVSAQDGVIEAVEGDERADAPPFVVGVQWHPERTMQQSEISRALFAAFMAAVDDVSREHGK